MLPHESARELGKRLRAARLRTAFEEDVDAPRGRGSRPKHAPLGQAELAHRLEKLGLAGADQGYVSDIELGQRQHLSAIELRYFALALRVDPDILMRGLGIPNEDVEIGAKRGEVPRAAASAGVRVGEVYTRSEQVP